MEYLSGHKVNLKDMDHRYIIRTLPAKAYAPALCLVLGQNAMHVGMGGRQKIDSEGWPWSGVLASTGRPRGMSCPKGMLR